MQSKYLMPDPGPEVTGIPRPKPWLTLALAIAMTSGFVAWLAGPPALKALRGAVARGYAEAALEHLEKEEISQAHADLTIARRWGADDPRVLRALADFLVKTGSDPQGLYHTLLRLEDLAEARVEDRIRLGEHYLSQGQTGRARAVLDRIPEADRSSRLPQELLANILRSEGRLDEAEKTLRRALSLAPNDPMSRLRLALLDAQSGFVEIRSQARTRLWGLAEAQDEVALKALDHLSRDSLLTVIEADRLLELVENHPSAPPLLRYRVISARLRVRPQLRQEVLAAELQAHEGKSGEQLQDLLQWLLAEQEYEQVRQLLPRDLALKSPMLLDLHLRALSGLKQWAEVDSLLAAPDALAVNPGTVSLWRAHASIALNQDFDRTRDHLRSAFEASGKGKQQRAALEVARIAENCGLWDVAAECYRGIASTTPGNAIPMLEKVHEMAVRERDTMEALQTARDLAEQQPANKAFSATSLYFQLLSGEAVEVAVRGLPNATAHTIPAALAPLLRALAAYRLGDLATMRDHVDAVDDPDSMTPGQQAVHAGLLSISGRVGPAYQLAETIPAALLLPEELRFLRRSL